MDILDVNTDVYQSCILILRINMRVDRYQDAAESVISSGVCSTHGSLTSGLGKLFLASNESFPYLESNKHISKEHLIDTP